jgi:hypothetical protein
VPNNSRGVRLCGWRVREVERNEGRIGKAGKCSVFGQECSISQRKKNFALWRFFAFFCVSSLVFGVGHENSVPNKRIRAVGRGLVTRLKQMSLQRRGPLRQALDVLRRKIQAERSAYFFLSLQKAGGHHDRAERNGKLPKMQQTHETQ